MASIWAVVEEGVEKLGNVITTWLGRKISRLYMLQNL